MAGITPSLTSSSRSAEVVRTSIEKLYLSLQRLTENTIEDIVNRSVNHKNMNNHNDLNINNKYKVLFVCLGNICRSPAAHGIFEHIVREKGMSGRIDVDSAGTYSGHRGELPDRRMRNAAMYRGYALTHRSRPVSSLDFLDFDMIIAMDDQNYEDLMHLAPSVEATHKIRRMAEFFTKHKISYVPDPYYMGAEGFQLVLDLLEEGCLNLFNEIIKAESF